MSTTYVLHVLVRSGDEHAALKRRDELIKSSEVETKNVQRLNLSQDEPSLLIDTVTSLDLFGGRRVAIVDHFEMFPSSLLKILGEGLSGSDALIVAMSEKAPTKAELAKLGPKTKVEKFQAPRGQGISTKVTSLVREHGLTLTGDQMRRLSTAGIEDFGALDDLLAQTAADTTGPVSEERFAAIEAAVMGDPMPWDLSDAMESGDTVTALRLIESQRGSAFGTFGYLSGRIRDLSLVLEAEATNPAEIQQLLGMRHPFPAKKMAQVARGFNPANLGALWRLVGEGDRRLRSESDERRVLAEIVVEMARQYV